ncbi:hypothetical protein Tco_0469962, partial [Tanacetum coccineum]
VLHLTRRLKRILWKVQKGLGSPWKIMEGDIGTHFDDQSPFEGNIFESGSSPTHVHSQDEV